MSDFERLLWYYGAGRLFIPRPRYLCYNCTLRCDQGCLHCGIWQDINLPELSAAELDPVLSKPFFSDVHTAWLTGGEPTMRSDLGELSGMMVRSMPGLRMLGLATNGIRTERVMDQVRGMCEALDPERQGLFVHISLDGVDEVYDRIRNMQGAFVKLMNTLDALNALREQMPELKIETGFNCVIQPENADNLESVRSFAKQRGISLTFNMVVVTDQIYRTSDKAESLSFSAEQTKKAIDFLKNIEPSSPPMFRYQYRIIRQMLEGRPRPRRCLTPYSTININADGTLIPCPAASDIFPVKVQDKDVDKVWRGTEARTMRSRIAREFCPDCMLSCSLGDAMSLTDRLQSSWDE